MNKRQYLINLAKNSNIGNFNKVVDNILSGKVRKGDIVYKAQTPYHSYLGFKGGTVRAYIWNGDGFELLFYNLSWHRARIAINNYDKFRRGEISQEVWNNYITGGYTTRAGLFRSKNTEKMKRMARSHADYLGNETNNSTTDHYNRTILRR
jgi:hypothetical protein